MQPFDSITKIEDAQVLDRVSAPLRGVVQRLLGPQMVRDGLHGVWLGHPLHPALVLVPLGAFMSAAVLDVVGDEDDRGARMLIGTGLVSAVPAAAAGLADWSQLLQKQQRVGLVHAVANAAGLACYAGSLAVRRRGNRRRGVALGLAGMGAITFGGMLGGHLSYRQAAGANHNADVTERVPAGWQDLCAVDDLPPDGTPTSRMLGDVSLFVLRRGQTIDVLADRCSHLSGPLHQGELSSDGSCITCPWHGSTFRLRDGSVVTGPTTSPQQAFDVRVREGRVEVQLAEVAG